MNSTLIDILSILAYIFLTYYLVLNIAYFIGMLGSYRRLKNYISHVSRDAYVAFDYTKPISVLVPFYNAGDLILQTIDSLLAAEYPVYEIIVINDGSRDGTLKSIIEHYDLKPMNMSFSPVLPCNPIIGMYASFGRPGLILIDKEPGGKADALNAGLNCSRYPLYCTVDPGVIIEKQSLVGLATPFMLDEQTVSVTGRTRISNGAVIENGTITEFFAPKESLSVFQVIEYLRSFLTGHIAWERIKAPTLAPGAFILLRKSVVQEMGGYKQQIGEDLELSLHLHEYMRQNQFPYKVGFIPEAVCWRPAPSQLGRIRDQRVGWHRGLIESLWTHKGMLFNPRYGVVGLIVLPYYWIVEMLGPLTAGLFFICLLVSLGAGMSPVLYGSIIGLIILYGLFFSFSALLLEELSLHPVERMASLYRMLFLGLLEPLVYRPLTVLWKIRAFLGYDGGQFPSGAGDSESWTRPAGV